MESSTNSDIRTVSAFLDKSLKNKFVFHMAIRQWERNVCFELQPGLRSFLERGVIEKFFNKVDVSQQHPAATVPFQAQGIESITFSVLGLKQAKICLPLISNNFAAREAANGNNHVDWFNKEFVQLKSIRSCLNPRCMAYARVCKLLRRLLVFLWLLD